MFRRREVERAMRAGIRAITNVRKVHTCANKCGVWKDTGYAELAKERTGHCGLIKM